MSIVVRKATIDDLEGIYSLELECFKHPYKKADWICELTKNPINIVLVAVNDNKIVGFIDYMITFNSATISQVAVCSQYRRQGIASLLMNEMENTFIKEGEEKVETVTLEVRVSNNAAVSLYKKHGYVEVVTKPHYYDDGEDALYMVKGI